MKSRRIKREKWIKRKGKTNARNCFEQKVNQKQKSTRRRQKKRIR